MVRRTLALVAALVAIVFAVATPAHAGGPTSVLLSAPPYVTAVGYDDQRYYDLQELVQNAPKGDEGGTAHEAGKFVRATWLIHDMSVWRIDIIYPDAPGGPWISTQEFNGTTPSKLTWHRPPDPERLREVLGSLRLLNAKFDGGPTLDDGYSVADAPVTTPAPAPAQSQVTGTNVFTGWRWIIPGVLIGAAAAVVAVRLFPKRRWELID
ncbi:hypothetical protein EV645_8231 [Kribbella rubisoli]|uniref:Uncharacterized protein n=1 Tax=Kribbella rubisoli TaxID=3075929 RepID=A0A4Q7VXE1_9ACTN|nr:hypothetical protein [Kribbella rubisoli]RZU01401.1 hypothetical protein EV645_8231 [Kribbella rubisoli]